MILEDSHPHSCRRENLKSDLFVGTCREKLPYPGYNSSGGGGGWSSSSSNNNSSNCGFVVTKQLFPWFQFLATRKLWQLI
jgi:hypothetical protein